MKKMNEFNRDIKPQMDHLKKAWEKTRLAVGMARERPERPRPERKLLGKSWGGEECVSLSANKGRNGQKGGCFLKSSADQTSWPTSGQRRPQRA